MHSSGRGPREVTPRSRQSLNPFTAGQMDFDRKKFTATEPIITCLSNTNRQNGSNHLRMLPGHLRLWLDLLIYDDHSENATPTSFLGVVRWDSVPSLQYPKLAMTSKLHSCWPAKTNQKWWFQKTNYINHTLTIILNPYGNGSKDRVYRNCSRNSKKIYNKHPFMTIIDNPNLFAAVLKLYFCIWQNTLPVKKSSSSACEGLLQQHASGCHAWKVDRIDRLHQSRLFPEWDATLYYRNSPTARSLPGDPIWSKKK